jgi:hypothetical protein
MAPVTIPISFDNQGMGNCSSSVAQAEIRRQDCKPTRIDVSDSDECAQHVGLAMLSRQGIPHQLLITWRQKSKSHAKEVHTPSEKEAVAASG